MILTNDWNEIEKSFNQIETPKTIPSNQGTGTRDQQNENKSTSFTIMNHTPITQNYKQNQINTNQVRKICNYNAWGNLHQNNNMKNNILKFPPNRIQSKSLPDLSPMIAGQENNIKSRNNNYGNPNQLRNQSQINHLLSFIELNHNWFLLKLIEKPQLTILIWKNLLYNTI